MESIKVMAEFTEIMLHNPKETYKFISNNYHRFDKIELAAIIKELLYGIQCDCKDVMEDLLEDVAIELDEQYDDMYQEV